MSYCVPCCTGVSASYWNSSILCSYWYFLRSPRGWQIGIITLNFSIGKRQAQSISWSLWELQVILFLGRKDVLKYIYIYINKNKNLATSFCDTTCRPVMHYFFLERFVQPADWFEKRLAYARSVAASSMVSVFYLCCDIDFGPLFIEMIIFSIFYGIQHCIFILLGNFFSISIFKGKLHFSPL